MDPYALCEDCEKPLIIEENLKILRKRILFGIGGGTIFGGVLGAAMLPLLGFGAAGVASGSVAATWQSAIGLVSAGSVFALLQSLGATGIGILLFGGIGAATGGGALGLIQLYANLFNWCECGQTLMESNVNGETIQLNCFQTDQLSKLMESNVNGKTIQAAIEPVSNSLTISKDQFLSIYQMDLNNS